MIAYIPARGGSKRIPKKNIKPLGEKPIIAHVIQTAQKLSFIDRVCVFTDDKEIQKVTSNYGAETGDLRVSELAGDFVGLMDLIKKDVFRFAGDADDLLLILPTAALVQKVHYEEAYHIYRKDSPDVLTSVTEYPISPLWAMMKGANNYWVPVYPEALNKRSKDLPKTCVDAGLFHFIKWKEIQKYKTLVVDKLMVYHIPSSIAVDVDTPEDWKRLELLFRTKEK